MKRKGLRSWLIFLGIVLLAFFGIRQVFLPHFFKTHDSQFHLSKLAQLVTLIREGQFPPRWSGTLNGGLGYPVYVFSYPLPFVLASLFYFLGFGLGGALEAVFVIAYLGSGVGFYLWARKHFSKVASFVGAVFFLYAPYRFSLVFVRGAIGEHLAYMFVPFILLGIYEIYQGSKRAIGWVGLLVGLGIIAHSLFLPLNFPLIAVYGVLFPFIQEEGGEEIKRYYMRLVVAFLISVGVSAFYLVPLVFERRYTVFDQVYTSIASEHLVSLKQLIHSPWGYGPSLPNNQKDLMSFQLGLAQLMVVVGGMGLMVVRRVGGWFLRVLKRVGVLGEKVEDSAFRLSLLSLVLFVLGGLAMWRSPVSVWAWKNLPGLNFVDFPWRYLGMTTFVAAVLASYVVDNLKYKKLLAVLLVVAALYANRNHVRINLPLKVNEQDVFADIKTTTTADEFMPVWRESGRSKRVFERRVESKEGELRVLEKKNGLVVFEAETEEAFEVQFNNLYFPGWRGYVKTENGWRRLKLGEELLIVDEGWGEYTKEEIDGTMRIKLPEGKHKIKMEFGETKARLLGDLVSVLSIIGIGWLLI